jgi:L-amino acid N-acyltransferase YncA
MNMNVMKTALYAPAEVHAPVSQLTEKIRDCCRTVRNGELSFAVLHENIMALEKLVFTEDPQSPETVMALSEITAEERADLNRAYCLWETELESQYARDILSGKETTLDNYLLYERFDRLVKRELSLLEGNIPQRVLFVGSGPLPISAFHIQRVLQRPVDCLDRDSCAVAISREVIEKLGLGESLRVFQGLGESFDIKEYDLILIALLASPKRRILRNLRKKALPSCRILCRTSFSLRTLVYEPTSEDVLGGFQLMAQQIAEGEQTISTFLLEGALSKAQNIKLRWLEEIDEQTGTGILRVMNQVLRNETTIGFPGPLDLASGQAIIANLNQDVKAQRCHVLVAEEGGRVVGQLILTPHRLPNCKHLVELSRGIIDPSFRGAGLALSAFREIAKKCDEIEAEVIYLDVRAGTVAAELWKSFGFVPFGKLADYARVNGRRYQGLYMSQTITSLKETLERISLGRKESLRTVRQTGEVPAFAGYAKRRVMPLQLLQFDDWRLKLYGINVEGRSLDPALIEVARLAAQDILPQPGVSPPHRYGLGFMIIHAAIDADFVVIGWWGVQNELFLRVLTAPPGHPQQLRQHSNMESSIACVWDLAVIWSEREAWTKYVMRADGPDIEGYLGSTQSGQI